VDGHYKTNTEKSMIWSGVRFIYGKLRAILLRPAHDSKNDRCGVEIGVVTEQYMHETCEIHDALQ